MPLVCLHGWFGEPADFDELFESLRSLGWPEDRHPLIAVSLPGHSGQPLPREPRTFSTGVAAVGETIIERLASVGLDDGPSGCRLLGYSMGGRIALALAAGLGPLSPRHVTILGAHPGLVDPEQRAARVDHDDRLADQLTAFDDALAFERFVRDWYEQPLFAPLVRATGMDTLVARRTRQNPGELAGALRMFSTGAQPPLGGADQPIATPVQALAGALDHKFVDLLGDLAERSAAVQFCPVPGAGHAAHLECPDTVAGLILAELDS